MTRPDWSLVIWAKESGAAIPPADLRRIIDPSRLDDQLSAFSRRGYHFTLTPKGALRLDSWPRRLFAEEIAHDLATDTVGRAVEMHWKVPSTNDLARAHARRHREGVAVFSEEQSSGRGRFGRIWTAPCFSSLLFSVPLHDPTAAVEPEGLMLAGAVAVAEAVSQVTHLSPQIRWPNDVLVEAKKVSGVLVESLPPDADSRWFVIGVGVNVNLEAPLPPDLCETAAALSTFTGRRVDRALLARHLLRRLDFWWDILKAGDLARLTATWRRMSSIIGTFVTLESARRRYSGRVVDLDTRLGLVLQLSGGPTRAFAPTDTTLIRNG